MVRHSSVEPQRNHEGAPQRAYAAALAFLARQRCTEARLWRHLERKGFEDEDVRVATERCKSEGFLDDRLYAKLYIEKRRKPVGNERLIGELIRKGIEGDAAAEAVASLEEDEDSRCAAAFERLRSKNATLEYSFAARRLERLGFPASTIYRVLRIHAARFGPLASLVSQ